VSDVVFPCAALCDADTGRLAIYHGAADTVTALAFAHVEELVRFAKEHSLLRENGIAVPRQPGWRAPDEATLDPNASSNIDLGDRRSVT
jgi:beta-1,4-mannooligosaccharide phosphorylase